MEVRTRKVLFVATVYTHLAAFHLPYIKLLQSWGCLVHAAARTDPGRQAVADIADHCWDIPFVRRPYHPQNLRAFGMLCGLIRRERFDLIHLHTPVSSALGRVAARITGSQPVLYTVHGFHFFRGGPGRNWLLYYPVERLLARWTDGLITINEEDHQIAQGFRLRRPGQLFLVPGVGLDLGRFAGTSATWRRKVRENLGLTERTPVLASVGELNANKNQGQMIRAMPEVISDFPNACYLVVGDGELRLKLETETRRSRMDHYIRFLGYRRDVPEILAAADAFVLTSRREGLPVSAIEAMAAGLPLVLTPTVGARMLAEDGVNGLLVPIGDARATAQAVRRLFSDPNLVQRMGAANRERVQKYDLKAVKTQMADIYGRYLSDRPPRDTAASMEGRDTRPGRGE